jgi:hypothetical protein
MPTDSPLRLVGTDPPAPAGERKRDAVVLAVLTLVRTRRRPGSCSGSRWRMR